MTTSRRSEADGYVDAALIAARQLLDILAGLEVVAPVAAANLRVHLLGVIAATATNAENDRSAS
jgi:hypothetical protein